MAVLALIVLSQKEQALLILRQDDENLIASYPLEEQQTFSITFIHSVNQSPVEDVFRYERGKIWGDRTIYYDFGAGVQSELAPGERVQSGEHGEIIITHVPKVYENLNYIVGTVSDHVLKIDDKAISLRALCGKNTAIIIRLR